MVALVPGMNEYCFPNENIITRLSAFTILDWNQRWLEIKAALKCPPIALVYSRETRILKVHFLLRAQGVR